MDLIANTAALASAMEKPLSAEMLRSCRDLASRITSILETATPCDDGTR